MGKLTLDINSLVSLAITNKKIKFQSNSEISRFKEMIEQHTYLNIFSLKYLFADGTAKTILPDNSVKHSYTYNCITKYNILEKQYKKLLKLENKLREGVLLFETELKSQFIFFLEDYFKINNINFDIFFNSLEIYNSATKTLIPFNPGPIVKEWNNQTSDYSNNYQNLSDYYYLLIKILSFGTIGRILDAHFNNKKVFTEFNNYLKRKNIFKIGKIIDELKTIIILRNSLCHKESFIIFLEKGYKKNVKLKLNIDFLQLRINAASHIYEYYEKRVNKRKKKLDNNSWIKNYLNYRLSNGKNNIIFSKIKIYL